VLADYGTGAIMCVPAHDERDFAFAKTFNLPIVQVIAKEGIEVELTEAFTETGIMINSGEFNGLPSDQTKEKVGNYVEEKGLGKKTTNYKLRDWVFSRQRYWGEPIPVVHCPYCGIVPIPEEELPVLLPEVESYEPTGTGESPLAAIDEWVNTTCPCCGKPAKRETNTMPQWAGSSWYFLRYVDVDNNQELVSKEAMKNWLPVDMYVGGIEHAVLHLLYSRFYTKFLYDIGVVDFEEPFTRLFNQGMICKNGAKMSKSKGNVVSPDELVANYGCDSLRMYELFVGPPELDSEWDDRGIEGVYRFVNKVWNLVLENQGKTVVVTKELEKLRHTLIYEVTERLNKFNLNTTVSAFMEYTNKLTQYGRSNDGVDQVTLESLVQLLSPFTPHIAEELWEILGHTESVFTAGWPIYDLEKMKEDTIDMPVQINGKLRVTVSVPAEATKEEMLAIGKAAIAAKLEGMTIIKEVVVPKKIINFVVK
jgi:leucyl-tRNA synthetase